MKRVLGWSGLVLALLALCLGGFVVAARSGWFKPREADLRARYALPASRSVSIAGQEVHVVDEGSRDVPTVLVVHASFASRRMWMHGRPSLALLGSRDKQLVVFPRCGHILVLDCPDASLRAAKAFIERIAPTAW